MAAGELAQAESSFRAALECDPDFAEAHANLAYEVEDAVKEAASWRRQKNTTGARLPPIPGSRKPGSTTALFLPARSALTRPKPSIATRSI